MPTDYTPESWDDHDTFQAAEATEMSQQLDEEEEINKGQLSVVIYGGSLSAARPSSPAVYWSGFPSTPTNAQAQDIIEGGVAAADLADYIVTVAAGTYTATPRAGSTLLAYSGSNFTTVLQNAITALTPPGTSGSGGGKIHLCKGTFTLTNEVVVTGWEGITGTSGIPQASLIIEGEGLSTRIIQNTSGQNAFVVKNLANVSIIDMYGSMGASAKSFILGDSNGAISEMSFWGGTIRVNVLSASTIAAPIYLKNFFDLDVPKLWAFASAFDAVILENASTAINYGNSHFGHVRTVGTSHAGLIMRTTDTAANSFKTLGMVDFDNYECNDCTNGILTQGVQYATFEFVDIENCATCINFDCTDLTHKGSRHISVRDGYLQPTSNGTAIRSSVAAGGVAVAARVQMSAASGATLINDTQQFLPRNYYNLRTNSAAEVAARTITSPKHVVYLSGDDDSIYDSSLSVARVDPNSLWAVGGAETHPRLGAGAMTLATGIAVFTYFTAPIANTISKLAFATTSTGASTGITLCRLALYTVAANGNLTMVARTANVATLGNAADQLAQSPLDATGGFVTSYKFIPGQRYAAALLQVGTTPSGVLSTTLSSAAGTLAPLLFTRATGQSDLATSYTAAGVPAWFGAAWIAGLV